MPVTRPVLEHYSLPFLDQMIAMVTATALISYIIYAVDSPFAGSKMLATAPAVLYGVFRYLYLIYDRQDTRSTAAIIAQGPGRDLRRSRLRGQRSSCSTSADSELAPRTVHPPAVW